MVSSYSTLVKYNRNSQENYADKFEKINYAEKALEKAEEKAEDELKNHCPIKGSSDGTCRTDPQYSQE